MRCAPESLNMCVSDEVVINPTWLTQRRKDIQAVISISQIGALVLTRIHSGGIDICCVNQGYRFDPKGLKFSEDSAYTARTFVNLVAMTMANINACRLSFTIFGVLFVSEL